MVVNVRLREGMVEVGLTQEGFEGFTWGLPSYMYYIGDDNPLEHGGTLFIQESDFSIRFLQFQERQEEGIVFTSDGIVDIDDYMDNMVEVKDYADIKVDLTSKDSIWENRFEIAYGLISYYGVENFGGYREKWTDEELAEMMKSFYGYSIEIV